MLRGLENRLKGYRKRLGLGFCLIAVISMVVNALIPGKVEAAVVPPTIQAKSAILVEATTGQVLFTLNEKEALPPASMTKMMTEYLVLEAVKKGEISWDQVVTISENAATLDGSEIWLYPGEKITVRELFEGMAVYSANDATVAFAELLGDSETQFVQMMQQKAEELGMKNTHFRTSSGYPPEDMKNPPLVDGEHVMSAEDSAILGRALIADHPEIRDFTTIPRIQRKNIDGSISELPNWNWLIEPLIKAYPGADGLKTGNTEAAGYCITATAERNGLRFVAVIMGASSIEARFDEARKLLDYGFANYTWSTVVKGKEAIEGYETVPVTKGRTKVAGVIPERDVKVLAKKGEETAYQVNVSIEGPVQAPLAAQQAVGKVNVVAESGTPPSYLSNIPAEEQSSFTNLVVMEEVKKASWFTLFFRSVGGTIAGLFQGILGGST